MTRRFAYFTLATFVVLPALMACAPLGTPLPPAPPTATPTAMSPEETSEPNRPTPPPTSITPIRPAPGTSLSGEAISANGPWLVFSSEDAVWAANANGTGASQLAGGFSRVTSPVAAPSGGHVAYVTAQTADYAGLELHLVSLPGGESKTLTPLTSAVTGIKPDTRAEDIPFSPNLEIARAILDVPSLAWSPDGKKLAFIGAMDGTSADLYIYSLSGRSLRQLTDGPSQGYRPTWSPDGKYIVHAGADSFGTGAGYAMAGVWAAQADGSLVKELYTPDSGDEVIAGWVSNSAFLVYSWGPGCGPSNLRTFDIETGETTQLWPGAFSIQGLGPNIAYNPATGAVLITLDEYTAGTFCAGDGQPKKPGLYLTNVRQPRPLYVSDVSVFLPVWDKNLNLFLASTEDGAVRVTTNGGITALAAPTTATPVISPDGTAWAWANSGFGDKPAGLWIGPVGQKAPTRVYEDAVYYATWSPDGQHVFFFADGGLYVTDRSGSSPVLLTKARSWSGEAKWVMP